MKLLDREILEISINCIVGPDPEISSYTDCLFESESYSAVASRLSIKLIKDIVLLSNVIVCKGRDKKLRYVTHPYELNLAAGLGLDYKIKVSLVKGLSRREKRIFHAASVIPYILYQPHDVQSINDLLTLYQENNGDDIFEGGRLKHKHKRKLLGVGRKKYCHSRKKQSVHQISTDITDEQEDITTRLNIQSNRESSDDK